MAAGIAIGIKLAKLPIKVHAFAVCDNKQYFEQHIEQMISALCEDPAKHDLSNISDLIDINDAYKGIGYAMSTTEELNLLKSIAKTGIMLDPVYTVKAMNGFYKERFFGDTAGDTLFVHTGGVFSNFAYVNQMNEAGLFDYSNETQTRLL